MFRQDCPEMKLFSIGGENFGDSGCGICSALHITEQYTAHCYTPREVQVRLIDMVHLGVIDRDFYIKSWNNLFSFLGIDIKIRKENFSYLCKPGEEEIIRLQKTTNGKEYEHFVPGDGAGHYSYDSLGRRAAQKDYEIHDKWIIKMLKVR